MHSFAVSLGTGHASVVVLRQSSVVIGYAYALVLCGCVSWFYSWTPQRSNQRHRVYSLLVFDVKTSTLKKKETGLHVFSPTFRSWSSRDS